MNLELDLINRVSADGQAILVSVIGLALFGAIWFGISHILRLVVLAFIVGRLLLGCLLFGLAGRFLLLRLLIGKVRIRVGHLYTLVLMLSWLSVQTRLLER